MSRLTLVVPCYNEEKRLDAAAFRNVAVDGHDIDFLFVNDGSRDGTLQVLESLRDENPARFAVLNLDRNSGKTHWSCVVVKADLDLPQFNACGPRKAEQVINQFAHLSG